MLLPGLITLLRGASWCWEMLIRQGPFQQVLRQRYKLEVDGILLDVVRKKKIEKLDVEVVTQKSPTSRG